MRYGLFMTLAALLAVQPVQGGQPASRLRWDNWAAVKTIRPGQDIVIDFRHGMGKRVAGTLSTSDDEVIVLITKHGEERVDRNRIRKVSAFPLEARKGRALAASIVFLGGLGATYGIIYGVRENTIFGNDLTKGGFIAGSAVLGGSTTAALLLARSGKPRRVYERAGR